MSQPAIYPVKTKNLDKYIDSQIESISSDYAHQHPLPPPPYFDDNHHKKKKLKHHHEPLPNIQILGHTAPSPKNNKPNKSKKKKKPKKKEKKSQQTTITKVDVDSTLQAVSTRAVVSGGHYGRSITPPPPNNNKNNNNKSNKNDTVFEFKSISSPFTQSARSASPPNKNGLYNHQNGRNHDQAPWPPLTANIAKLEQSLQTYNLTTKSPIFGYLNNAQNLDKAHKILGVSSNTTCQPQNRKATSTPLLSPPTEDVSMNKNHSNSICSIESLDADDGTGLNNRGRNSIAIVNNIKHKHKHDLVHTDDDDNDDSMTIESVVTTDNEDDTNNNNNHNHNNDKKDIDKKPKIRMWNALAYGLEDPVEGKTFEWVDSKFVRLLQLSTYSTVMGPKVKFVWKNSEIYNLHSIKLQKLHNDHYDVDSDNNNDDDDDKVDEFLKPQPRTARPEFAYHELEAWIAKQTLDCTGWKNKHNKTAPPPFTKKTMIAPEFGVVLCCIQFDSSLRALRNKQFNQYINGIYTHTPAHINQSGTGQVPYTPKSTKTPNKPHKFVYNKQHQQQQHTGGSNDTDSVGVLPSSSPYDHNTMDDSSPNHQIPSSYSQKSYSSRFSSPPSGYMPMGDTLADYLSKFAPFSFSAGLSGGMNVSGANIPQVPYNRALMDVRNNRHNQQQQAHAAATHNNNLNTMHHIDDNEDPDDIGHYSLVLAVEYKYFEKFIHCLDAIEHWLYMIASQIRYLLALNKCFKCDQMEHSLKLTTTDINDDNALNESLNDFSLTDEDCPDRLHTIIPFMTNIAPCAIFKFDQLFSATFDCSMEDRDEHDVSVSDYLSMSSSYLMSDPRDGMIYNMNYIPSRGLPKRISLFETWFTSSLDNRDKHKLSIMISSHLQTLGRTVIIGDDEQEIDRYISTMALFSTSQQKSLSRLSVKVDNSNNLSSHYIPELYLQGLVIPTIKAPLNIDVIDNNSPSSLSEHVHTGNNNNGIDNDYTATVAYLQSSPAIKQLQEDLYLAPGPSTLVLLTSSKHIHQCNGEEKQSFWWIRQTAMPHKFKQEQQSLLFQKLFYLRRRIRRRRNSSSYIYARKRSLGLFDSPSRNKDMHIAVIQQKSNNAYLTPPHGGGVSGNSNESPPNRNVKKSPHQHQRTLERKKQQEKETDLLISGQLSSEFKSMNKIYRPHRALNEDYEHNGDTIDTVNLVNEESDEDRNYNYNRDDNESVTATSVQSGVTSVQSSIPQPIHAPHLMQNDHKNLTFVEPSLSPMIATIVFGSFNIPQELKMTFLETQFRILLEKASEILLYIEHEQKDLLSFYDKTCHVMSCKEFKEQVPMEALYPQIMQKFESQLRSDLQISRQEDLYVLLSISEGFRPNLFSLMFGNPVFDIEVADILRYFLF